VRIVSHDEHPPYNRPPLSKDFLRGESEADELPLEEPSFYVEQGIELLLGTEVVDLDLPGRSVLLADGRRLEHDALVLAMGNGPAPLEVPGADHDDVLVLRSRAQGTRLRAAAERSSSAVVIGSGFIGCEAAVSLALRGLDVTMVSSEPLPQAGRLGEEVGERIAGWLREAGVRLVAGQPVDSVEDGRTVHLPDGSSWTADLVVAAAGARPRTGLAERAGLATTGGRLVVDDHMRTLTPGVYAAGDIAYAHNGAAGRRLAVEHWGEATRMGEIAGTNAAGGDDSWSEVPGFWSEIGEHTLKYGAWGDGHDDVRLVDHGNGAFTAWYARDGVLVGVLTHDADDDYESGQQLVEQGAPSAR
jgi:3-phenylpropionate/trans-cinnamate dioxygenase ferredoxin reductase subunit